MELSWISIAAIVPIWIVNGRCIADGIANKVYGEIYHHTGIGLFFTLIVFELFSKNADLFIAFDIPWLRVIGYLLFVPSAIFIGGSLYQLRIRNNAGSLGPKRDGRLVKAGVFRIVRHPMWLGFSIWSVALVLQFQTLFSLIVCTISIFCFRIASIKEDEEGIHVFQGEYSEYMAEIPMWNFIRGIRREKR